MKWIGCIFLLLVLPGCLGKILRGESDSDREAARKIEKANRDLLRDQLESDYRHLQSAVNSFEREHGRFPWDLSELGPPHIEEVPLRPDGEAFGYNPITGEIYRSNEGPAPEDYAMMGRIWQAIQNHGAETGYYPATLEALYPRYLPVLPRTASGGQFTYNNQTGELRHPDEGKQHSEVQFFGIQPAGGDESAARKSTLTSNRYFLPVTIVLLLIAGLFLYLKVWPGIVRFVMQVRGYKRSPEEDSDDEFGRLAAACGLPFFIYGATLGPDIFIFFHDHPRLYENPWGHIIAYGFNCGLVFHVAGALLIGVPVEWVLRKIFDP